MFLQCKPLADKPNSRLAALKLPNNSLKNQPQVLKINKGREEFGWVWFACGRQRELKRFCRTCREH